MKVAALLRCACLVLLASPAFAQDDVPTGSGVQVGDRCYQGDQPPRPGLVCLPSFVTIDGFLREEWEYETSYILNARKGDAVLSAGCELIANLLRKVYPPQTYSHAGVMVEDRHKIRHSTASVGWVMEQRAGDPPGSEGLLERALKYAWPGTLTQWADDALEGAFVKGPNDVFYEMKSFNPSPVQCGDNGQIIPDTILKPPPLVDADPASGARDRLHTAADAAQNIDGHYRFFGYSQPAEVLYSSAVVPGDWADGTVGSVCSAFVWRSMKDAGITLEGATLEANDIAERGAAVDAQTADGTYIYTAAERPMPRPSSIRRSGKWSPRRSPASRTWLPTSPMISAIRWSTVSASTGAARRSPRSRGRPAATRTTSAPRIRRGRVLQDGRRAGRRGHGPHLHRRSWAVRDRVDHRRPYDDPQPGPAARVQPGAGSGQVAPEDSRLRYRQDHRHRGLRQRRSRRVEFRSVRHARTEHEHEPRPGRADVHWNDALHRRRSEGQGQDHRPAQRARPLGGGDAHHPDVRRDVVQRRRSRQYDHQAAGGSRGRLEERELHDGERGIRRRASTPAAAGLLSAPWPGSIGTRRCGETGEQWARCSAAVRSRSPCSGRL